MACTQRDIFTGTTRLSIANSAWYPLLSSALDQRDVFLRAFASCRRVRVLFHFLPQLAVKYQAYVVVATILPRFTVSTDPQDIALFGDPDLAPHQSEVYLATGPDVFNTAFVYSPAGELLGNVSKHHLTPVEVSLLQLTPANISANRVIPTPIGALCVSICWDTFFKDVVGYLDKQGCQLLAHPSYNDGMWASWLSSGSGNSSSVWQPLDWTRGPFAALQLDESQHISVVANAMVTGNLFDMVVDGQSVIVQRAPVGTPLPAPEQLYIGLVTENLATPPYNLTDGGVTVLARAPWAFADNTSLPLDTRRNALAAQAALLAPGSNSSFEGQYANTVIFADVTL